MSHSIKPLVVFEVLAANKIGNGFEIVICILIRKTGRYQKLYGRVTGSLFLLDFTLVRLLEVPGRFTEVLPEVNGEKNEKSLRYNERP